MSTCSDTVLQDGQSHLDQNDLKPLGLCAQPLFCRKLTGHFYSRPVAMGIQDSLSTQVHLQGRLCIMFISTSQTMTLLSLDTDNITSMTCDTRAESYGFKV